MDYYINKKLFSKAPKIVPFVRDNYNLIMIVYTILQFLLLAAGITLFYYTFYVSDFLIILSIFSFLAYIYISLQKGNIKIIYSEIRRQLKCKQLSKSR